MLHSVALRQQSFRVSRTGVVRYSFAFQAENEKGRTYVVKIYNNSKKEVCGVTFKSDVVRIPSLIVYHGS